MPASSEKNGAMLMINGEPEIIIETVVNSAGNVTESLLKGAKGLGVVVLDTTGNVIKKLSRGYIKVGGRKSRRKRRRKGKKSRRKRKRTRRRRKKGKKSRSGTSNHVK